jgi:hypothetical protein
MKSRGPQIRPSSRVRSMPQTSKEARPTRKTWGNQMLEWRRKEEPNANRELVQYYQVIANSAPLEGYEKMSSITRWIMSTAPLIREKIGNDSNLYSRF